MEVGSGDGGVDVRTVIAGVVRGPEETSREQLTRPADRMNMLHTKRIKLSRTFWNVIMIPVYQVWRKLSRD